MDTLIMIAMFVFFGLIPRMAEGLLRILGLLK